MPGDLGLNPSWNTFSLSKINTWHAWTNSLSTPGRCNIVTQRPPLIYCHMDQQIGWTCWWLDKKRWYLLSMDKADVDVISKHRQNRYLTITLRGRKKIRSRLCFSVSASVFPFFTPGFLAIQSILRVLIECSWIEYNCGMIIHSPGVMYSMTKRPMSTVYFSRSSNQIRRSIP